MEIKPSEVELVEQIGYIDGAPVKMIKTVGGFWMVVGKPKGKKKDEALAAGSHPAIVKYNVEKQFSDFQPSLAKSEIFNDNTKVVGYSELLPKQMRNLGYEMYSVQDSSNIQFILTKRGASQNKYEASLETDSLKLSKAEKSISNETLGFSKAVAAAAARQALFEGKEFVEHDGKRFKSKTLLKG